MKNRNHPILILTNLALAILLAGCSLFNPTPASDWPGRSATLTALAPVADSTSTPEAPTDQPGGVASNPTSLAPQPPTATSLPPTVIPSPIPTQSPCYRAELVKDVTIPDGTVLAPGKQFVKTWQLWNTGSCDWQPSMVAVFDGGTQLSANLEYNIGKKVSSGKMVDVSIPMTAPLTAGEYTSNWRLKPAGGTPFGVGGKNVPFYVKIVVGDTVFKVTDVTVSVNNSSATAACPPGFTFQYTAKITATGPGEVIYRWVFGESSSQDESITFSGAGSQSVNSSRTVSSSTTETAKIYIVQPNRETFLPGVSYSMTCQ
jgi:hypothetical protein